METSSSGDLIGCWAEIENFGKESYPEVLASEEEEEEPGESPNTEEEKEEEEEREEAERGEEEEKEEERGEEEEEREEEEKGKEEKEEEARGEENDEERKEEKEEERREEKEEETGYKVEDLFPEEADDSPFLSDVPRPPSVLEQPIRDEVMSDASTGSGHDPYRDRDDLSDCLQVEFAVVSSDSDVDDQGKTIAVGNKEEVEIQDGGSDVDSLLVLEQPSSPPPACQLQTSSPQAPSLGLIPEDEEGCLGNVSSQAPVLRSPSTSSSTSDPDRRVPQDYCVLQENVSENVSEEHVDFLSTRQQWRQMEEQVKGQVLPQPGVRAGSGAVCAQAGHNFLYMPLRSVEHPRRGDLAGDSLHHATFSPCSEDSGVDELSGRSPYEEPENQVEREIRLTLEREENFRRERIHNRTRPSTLHPLVQPDARRRVTPSNPTFSISPSPSSSSSSSSRPVYHEMSANNVIILEPDSSSFPASSRQRPHGLPLLSPSHAPPHFSDWSPNIDPSSVIILETSNLIIRSASEFCLSSVGGGGGGGGETVLETTFSSNPFFKLRSRSSMSLVEQEIRAVRQREEDWRRQRAQLQLAGTRERYDTVLVSPSLLEGLGYDRGEVPVRCVSSPSSPSRVRKMDRSTLSCDHKFPSSLSCSSPSSTSSTSSPAFAVSRRQSALAQRWEASLLANHSKD